MLLPAMFVGMVVIATALWALFFRGRHAHDMESLMAQLKPPISSSFNMPQAYDMTRQREEDDKLCRDMDGIKGIWRMHRKAGILFTMATRMDRELEMAMRENGEADLVEPSDNSIRSLALRISLLRCLGEHLFLSLFPRMPVPRLMLRFTVDQYAELCAAVRAMLECQHPTLLDGYDGVI